MATKKFDRGKVLDSAIDLFWHHGFNGSSMQQVTKYTGLKPGSIYNEFGSKEGLFCEALKHYAESAWKLKRSFIEKGSTVGEGICNLLEFIVEDSQKKDYCSCLVIKTQLELAAAGTPLYEQAQEILKDTENLIYSYLEKEYGAELSLVRAASVMVHIFGLRVYGYKTKSAELQLAALREGLPWLPWE